SIHPPANLAAPFGSADSSSRLSSAVNEQFELNGADLNDVIRLEWPLLARLQPRSVHPGAVEAVEILDEQHVPVEGNGRVLPRTPDLPLGFLADQIDIHRAIGEAADHVPPFVNGVLEVNPLAAKDHDLGVDFRQ